VEIGETVQARQKLLGLLILQAVGALQITRDTLESVGRSGDETRDTSWHGDASIR
jgi:hypothetical protein